MILTKIFVGTVRGPGAPRKHRDPEEVYAAKLESNRRWRARNREKVLEKLRRDYQKRKGVSVNLDL